MSDPLPCCCLCDYDVKPGQRAVILRVGTEKKSPKSGEWHFQPELFDDGVKDKWCHERCVQDLFDLCNNHPENTCMFEGCELSTEVWYCELEFGEVEEDRDGPIFFREERGYSCWDCIFDGVGEGNALRARQILGMDDGGEDDLTLFDTVDKNRWVNYGPEEEEKEDPVRRGPPKRLVARSYR